MGYSKRIRRPDSFPTVKQAPAPPRWEPSLPMIPNSAFSGIKDASMDADAMDRAMREKMTARFGRDYRNARAEAEADQIGNRFSAASGVEDLKSRMGAALGADFSGVRFHTGAEAASMAAASQAEAFTSGRDIYLGSPFKASTAAHEMVHTVQQGAVQAAAPVTSAPAGAVQYKLWDNIKKYGKKAGSAIGSGLKTAGKAVGRGAAFVGKKVATGAKAAYKGIKASHEKAMGKYNNKWKDMSTGQKVGYALMNPVAYVRANKFRSGRSIGVENVNEKALAEKIAGTWKESDLGDARIAEAPQAENATAPKAENVEAPKTENATAPKAENTTAPKAENTTAPKAENTEAPQAENTTAPQAENTTAPKAENATAPQAENTTAPQAVPAPSTTEGSPINTSTIQIPGKDSKAAEESQTKSKEASDLKKEEAKKEETKKEETKKEEAKKADGAKKEEAKKELTPEEKKAKAVSGIKDAFMNIIKGPEKKKDEEKKEEKKEGEEKKEEEKKEEKEETTTEKANRIATNGLTIAQGIATLANKNLDIDANRDVGTNASKGYEDTKKSFGSFKEARGQSKTAKKMSEFSKRYETENEELQNKDQLTDEERYQITRQRAVNQASRTAKIRRNKGIVSGVGTAFRAVGSIAGALLGVFIPGAAQAANVLSQGGGLAAEALTNYIGGKVTKNQEKNLRRQTVDEELGIEEKIQQLRSGEGPQFEKLGLTKEQAGKLNKSQAKHIILKSMGFKSGKYKEAYAQITRNRAGALAQRANEGGEEETEILKSMMVNQKDGKYNIGDVAAQMGMEDNDYAKAALARSYAAAKGKQKAPAATPAAAESASTPATTTTSATTTSTLKRSKTIKDVTANTVSNNTSAALESSNNISGPARKNTVSQPAAQTPNKRKLKRTKSL